METKFNFKSQVCTSIDQSRRLLELGLKKETADMHYDYSDEKWKMGVGCNLSACEHLYPKYYIPAWSLHRLIEICGEDRLPISFHKKGKVKIRVNHIHPTHDGRSGYNYYDSIIDCIEWLINEGYFNKEYLCEK